MKNRALICLVIVVILMALSQGIDRGPRPKTLHAEMKGPAGEMIGFEHRTVPLAPAGDSLNVVIDKLEIPARLADAQVFYRSSSGQAYKAKPMHFSGGHGRFEAWLPGLSRGEVSEYYILVTDLRGNRLSLPSEAAGGGLPLTIFFQGRASWALRLLHALLVYGTLYLFLLSSFVAFDVWLRGRRVEDCFPSILAGMAGLFIGGFPVAWIVAHARTGSFWQGSHVSPAAVALLFWILLLLLVRDRLRGREEAQGPVGPRTFAGLVVVGTVLTFFLYVIPHRI